ncbi:MAG: hypothetical protein GY811_15015 [Myxococcales bacterium]|nr:hypothetical protein [Myxococcales bacterium]
MNTPQSKRRKPRITGAHAVAPQSNVKVKVKENDEHVSIIVTQLFGPAAANLVGISDVTFDGYPAFTLLVKTEDGKEGLVHLSPIHGDDRKIGMEGMEPGTKCQLFCPVSKQPLAQVFEVPDDQGTEYFALYLTPKLSQGSHILISNVWGHYHSRVVDNFELISSWMPQADDLS